MADYCTAYLAFNVGRDSVVGIATRYGLDGPEIERVTAHEALRYAVM
jgi:hypothetical protein